MSKTGVGFTQEADSFKAGAQAMGDALKKLGNAPDLVFIYHTAIHSPQKFREGVMSVVGNKPTLIGGFAAGIITNEHLAYNGYQGGVAALKMDKTKFGVFVEKNLDSRGEIEAGSGLAKQIRSQKYEGQPGLIYMYDTVKSFKNEKLEMNLGTYVIEGMSKNIGTWPTTAGMGMIGNMQFSPTYQYFKNEILQQALLGVVFHGSGFRMDTAIFHGCRPASDYFRITKTDRNVILEIEERPALEKIQEILGGTSEKSWDEYPFFLTLGLNRGDKYSDYNEDVYANRLCMGIDKERKGIVMFEPDLVAGMEVQLMRRSFDFQYIQDKAQALYDRLGNRKPFFALYIDCAGRAGAFCGSEKEEGAEIQRIIGSKMPLLGLYTGVEIGQVGQVQQALDWTGVLCVLSEE